ncbi:MAG: hypothetical protein FJY95_01015 [Candidatus Handelsmanbacteria bacterium]|nr:hypothetical protein [Candidatus Handelsmanbacteria bacterium]
MKTRLAISLLLAALAGAPAQGQPLTASDPEREFLHVGDAIDYEGYGLNTYTRPPIHSRRVPRYDRMGNFLMVGDLAYAVDERRPGLSRFSGLPRDVYWGKISLNYAVLRDAYKGTGYSLMVLTANPDIDARQLAEAVRTRFSPLTMSIGRFAGVRLDARGLRNQSTFVFSRGASERKRFSFFAPARYERSPVILWGGHWQSTVGAALKVGTTFVNQHLIDAASKAGGIFRGNIPYPMKPPKTLFVRLTSDLPDDPQVVAVGQGVSILLTAIGEGGVQRTLTGDPALAVGGVELDPRLAPAVTGRRVGDHYEAQGRDERVEFAFSLPANLEPVKIEFAAAVGGDYRLGIRQVHEFVSEDGTRTSQGAWPATGEAIRFERAFLTKFDPRYPTDFKFPEKDPVYTVARARGRGDQSLQVVRFDYGVPTAQTLASTDFSFQYKDYTLGGEVAFNVQDLKFPVPQGRRHQRDYLAYFLKGSGELPYLPERFRAQVGGEVFAIPAAYSGGYDAKRGGSIFSTEVATSPQGPVSQEFDLYDDNDDNDQWPDDHPNDSALSDINDAGVFPGLDEDGDNVIDTDRNGNGRPDWAEPFMAFGADPPEFVYDLDFNNNDLPDMTENDDEPDYPYRRGQRGAHGFVGLPGLLPGGGRLGVGHYRMKAPFSGGESRGKYLRLNAVLDRENLGQLRIENLLKRVEDHIPDPSYIWKVGDDPSVNMLVVQSQERTTIGNLLDMRPPDPDPMLMRNSTVNTLYLESKVQPLPGMEVLGRNKLMVNRQHADRFDEGGGQADHTLYRWTLSNRVSYGRELGPRLRTNLKLKHLFRWDRGYGSPARFSVLEPVVEVFYTLSPKVQLHAGQDGWPLFPFRYTDLEEGANSFERRTSLVLVKVDWSYWGWIMTSETGMQWESRRVEDQKQLGQRTFFFELYVGF